MRILLSNDDGFDAKGIQSLYQGLKDDFDVTVCAPESEKSGSSHGSTYFFGDRRYERRGKDQYAVDGTPADCVYYAVNAFMKEKPDLLISGINHGQNLSSDVIYSGTVGAAGEGMIAGIPSMAVSLCSYTSDDFSNCVEAVKKLIPVFTGDPHRYEYILNVNVPAEEKIRGYRITHLENGMLYNNKVTLKENHDETGIIHTERVSVRMKEGSYDPEGDATAMKEGYISLTPLHNDMTAFQYISHMKQYAYLK